MHVEVSETEASILARLRSVRFGVLSVEVVDGAPKVWHVTYDFRDGKEEQTGLAEWPGLSFISD